MMMMMMGMMGGIGLVMVMMMMMMMVVIHTNATRVDLETIEGLPHPDNIANVKFLNPNDDGFT